MNKTKRKHRRDPGLSGKRRNRVAPASIVPVVPVADPEVEILVRRRDTTEGERFWFTDAGVALVRQWAADGYSRPAIAAQLQISHDTLRLILKRQPEAAEAVAAGIAINERNLVSVLHKKALGGDTIALLFLLKAKHGWREGTEREGAGPTVAVQINLPGPSPSVADYLRTLPAATGGDNGDPP